ncbi:hypothetical protein PYK79_41585 [Streptomyces sp. ID05-04B]|uniref:hypothetical protein n=1 Tax=unclassified Streptomyces TaxID=2593676 RepID=UPI000D1A63A8|nr:MULTISPECIES: hypothetical protein [unclassified Streptomyces]AVV46471.1 hypothetical protein C6376_39040 [Streptomyces sp. P3]AVV46832.1 hypothetical protein C6376_41445 [Streptomyces sp. P3]MDX5568496.1 hypothetical protein [Streptomyces sp. ID05-04B]
MGDFADTRVSLTGQGTLVAIAQTAGSGGACLANVAGLQVTVRIVAGLSVAAGNVLLILRRGSTYWAIATLGAAPVVAPSPPSPDTAPPSTGDPAPAPKPDITTGVLTCPPVATATYRDGSWRSDGDPVSGFDTYQGRYAGSSFGRMTGCAFYGTKPRSLSGATVTKATLKARRLSGGDFAARTPTLRLVSQSTRPSGAPTLNETTAGPSLAVNATTTSFTIPTAWAQAMVDGTRGGLAISIGSDTPYIHLAGRGSWSAAWTLTIYWRRG